MTFNAPDMDSGRSDWGGIWLGLAISSLAAFQMLKLPPALPLMIDAYGYDRITAGALVSIYALSGLVLSVAVGRLASRHPVVIMGGSLAFFMIGNLITLALPEIAWLNLAARALEGFAYAVFAIAGPALANRSAVEKDLSSVAGIVAIWVPVGQILALGVGYLTFHAYGWQPLWWVSVVLTALVGVWLWLRWKPVSHALAGLADGATAFSTTQREQTLLWFAGIVFAIWGGQYIAFMTWLPDYMVDTFGVGAHTAAAANALCVVGVLLSGLSTGWLLRKGVPLGLLFGGATLIQAVVWIAAPYMGAMAGLVAITLYGIVSGAAPTCLFAVPGRLLGGDRAGPTAFGPLMAGRNLGIFATPILAGWLIGFGGWHDVGLIFGAITFVSTIAGVVMARAILNNKKAA
jgi:predicted MFS family arabinose efflux permease